MIYSAYVAVVLEQLTVDAARRGLEDFRAQQIRNSVVDLQRFIRGYRKGHTTTYAEGDLTQIGCAARGAVPDGAIPSALYIQSTATVTHPPCDTAAPVRNRLDLWPWDHRDHLSYAACDRRLYAYTLSPFGTSFIIHPALNDETELLLVWEGIKRDFADGDTVPWPEDASEASAAYVKWQINLQVDKNIPLAREYRDLYSTKRLALYRDFQERLDAEKPDEEPVSGIQPAPGTMGEQAGSVALTLADVSAAVVFPTAFVTAPIADCWLVPPDNTWPIIDCSVDGSSITTAGFTALFAGAIPSSGWRLFWRASPVS
jgi:hypothetical protein